MSNNARKIVISTAVVLGALVIWAVFTTYKSVNRPAEASEVTIIASGHEIGFIEPCGCALAQFGGLGRRASMIKSFLNEPSSPLLSVHNGGVIDQPGWQQELKLEIAVEAMKQMGYQAMNIGAGEASLEWDVLNRLAQSAPYISANLRWKDKPPFRSHVIETIGQTKVSIVGVISESSAQTAEAYNPDILWESPASAARQIVRNLRPSSDICILLFHGDRLEAHELAEETPEFDIVIAHDTSTTAPFADLVSATETWVVTTGTKGQMLSVFDFNISEGVGQHRALAVSDAHAPDPNMEILLDLYHDMVEETASARTAARTSQQRESIFVGSETCGSCHASSHSIWADSRHSHAYDTLVHENRERDPECLVCHVVGLENGGFISKKLTPQFAEVGCEMCHGGGKEHVANPTAPYITTTDCLGCHTKDTSPHFDFKSYWEKIAHK